MDTIYIDGTWYDVTDFIKRHPGGNVIKHYLGEDASLVYKEMHRRSTKSNLVLKTLPVVNRTAKPPQSNQAMISDFYRWRMSLQERGFFEPNMSHVLYRILELAAIFILATWFMSIDNKILGTITYGLFGGRCGWVQHEAGHRSLTGNISTDNIIQKVTNGFGTLTSGSMWNHMHNRHHASTQKVGYDMDLDTMPFVLFHEDAVKMKMSNLHPLSKLWLKYQAYTFLPITSGVIVMMFWVFYLHPRKIIRDNDYVQGIFTIGGHVGRTMIIQAVTGHTLVQSYLWLLASLYVTGLYLFGHFSTSHTFMPIVDSTETPNWVEYSVHHTADIDTQNPWVSWIMGYLNCQCIHHLFPQMPQYRHPEVSKELREFAKKWELNYREVDYWEAWALTFQNLHMVGGLLQK